MEIVKSENEKLPGGIYFVTIKMPDVEKAVIEVQAAINSSQFQDGNLIQLLIQPVPVINAFDKTGQLHYYVIAVVKMP